MTHKPKILLVDDKPQNLYVLEKLLQPLGVELFQTTSGSDALGLALENDFCVAIVDVQMPEMDGYELAELLRGYETTMNLPIIFVSAIYSDEYHHRKGYEAGAVDFISKPYNPDILLSKIKIFIDLYLQRQKLQTLVEQLNEANQTLSKRTVQLETSNQVGQQITSILDLQELLDQVVDLIQMQFGYYFVGMWLLNETKDHLVLQVRSQAAGQRPAEVSLPVTDETHIASHVWRTKEMYQANQVENLLQDLPLTRSQLALPLQNKRKFMGVLDIHSARPAAFAPDDVTVLRTIADQIAIAIRNAQLYAKVVSFNEELEGVVQERTVELKKAYKILEKLDKTKSDFISIAAHELRTPLTLIRGYAEILNGMVSAMPEAAGMVNGILTGEGRLFEIVNSMLDVSKIDNELLQTNMQPTNLVGIIDDICADLGGSFEERQLTLVKEGLQNIPVIEGDAQLLRKVFAHLIGNAIKYTPNGGRIAIVGSPKTPNGLLAVPAVEISVADTGIGIDPDNHELIFDKFFQTGRVQFHSSGKTKFKGGGPGLGLAIVRGIVEAHRGQVWVNSPGHDEQSCPGSTFHVVLPIEQIG